MFFPSSRGPPYQSEVKCPAFDMEMIFFILVQIKLIFTRKVVRLASFCNILEDPAWEGLKVLKNGQPKTYNLSCNIAAKQVE